MHLYYMVGSRQYDTMWQGGRQEFSRKNEGAAEETDCLAVMWLYLVGVHNVNSPKQMRCFIYLADTIGLFSSQEK